MNKAHLDSLDHKYVLPLAITPRVQVITFNLCVSQVSLNHLLKIMHVPNVSLFPIDSFYIIIQKSRHAHHINFIRTTTPDLSSKHVTHECHSTHLTRTHTNTYARIPMRTHAHHFIFINCFPFSLN